MRDATRSPLFGECVHGPILCEEAHDVVFMLPT